MGLGHWSKSPNSKMVRNDILGFIQYGAGVKFPVGEKTYLRVGPRFTHTSSVPGKDTGANTYGILLGIVKHF